ncbi:hypothetical protein AAVH_02975 [Aphelenchoides avenae]|nr:hypothetical protein AAVH_02975 [Aphelenchus avenae]
MGSKTTSEKDRKLANLQSQLDCAEQHKMETERLVQVLQREVSGLELRNTELVEEITWLKDQIGTFPEVAKLPHLALRNATN